MAAGHRGRSVLRLLGRSAGARGLRPPADGRLVPRRAAPGRARAGVAPPAGDPPAGADRARHARARGGARARPRGRAGPRRLGGARLARRAGPGAERPDHDRHAARPLLVRIARGVRPRRAAPLVRAVRGRRDRARTRVPLEVLRRAPRPGVRRLRRGDPPRRPSLARARGRRRLRGAVRAREPRVELRALLGEPDVQRLQPAQRGRFRLVPAARLPRAARVRGGPAARLRPRPRPQRDACSRSAIPRWRSSPRARRCRSRCSSCSPRCGASACTGCSRSCRRYSWRARSCSGPRASPRRRSSWRRSRRCTSRRSRSWRCSRSRRSSARVTTTAS